MKEPFDERRTCPTCGGPQVRRRDGQPGRRCARCGRPADELRVRVRLPSGEEGWLPRSALLAGRW